jgi:5'-nucleotidase
MMPQTPLFQRILLTNDDGIDAPGLAVLEEVAASLAHEVWVVAPAEDQSGTSHSISLHSPLRAIGKGPRRFAVRGTPGDCVALAVGHLMGDAMPDLILSGINRGANLGTETVFSGTVGAAMTGMLLGIPAIALSQAFRNRNDVPWDVARQHAAGAIRRVVETGWDSDACININFPVAPVDQVKSLKATRQGAGMLQGVEVVSSQDPREVAYHWLRLKRAANRDADDTETGALEAGHITATPLKFERTHEQGLAAIREKWEQA